MDTLKQLQKKGIPAPDGVYCNCVGTNVPHKINCPIIVFDKGFEAGKEEAISENGANSMCDYWYEKGKAETLAMVLKEIEEKSKIGERFKDNFQNKTNS